MKKSIIIIIFSIGMIGHISGQVEPTNKFLFSSGLKNNEWNKSYIGSQLMYFNQVDEDNPNLYIEAERVLAM